MLNLPVPPGPDQVDIKIKVIKASQPIGDLYFGALDSSLIVRITDFDVRRVIEEERDVEKYLGIQRPLDKRRVAELDRYVNFVDATFPTACILAVDADYVDFEEVNSTLVIKNYRDGEISPSTSIRHIARVLDGQHRIAGLRAFSGDIFEVPVVFFVGADISEQANIFSTVNLEQNKVGRSLAYDLFALAKIRSPQRLTHEIAVAFDRDPSSPFFRRIKRLGVATPGRYNETLAQSQFVEALLGLITRDPKVDRDILLRGKKIPRPTHEELQKYIFRGMFVDERDIDIAKSVDVFFRAVKDKWPDAWSSFGRGYVLNKTSGFRALMRLLRVLYLDQCSVNEVLTYQKANEIISRSNIEDSQFNTDIYKPGSSGEALLFNDLKKSCRLFSP